MAPLDHMKKKLHLNTMAMKETHKRLLKLWRIK